GGSTVHEANVAPVGSRRVFRRRRHELVAPAWPPPVGAGGEIDLRVGDLPAAPPQLDGGVLVGGRVAAQRERRSAHRSVSFSSMRRLRLKASSGLSGSIGWDSPEPAGTRPRRGTVLPVGFFSTRVARPARR